jgi:DNA repair protein RecO (recombination protein O)
MSKNGVRTRAIVLRRTNYGEADRILQLLTPEGKKSVMAKGVRREKSKLAGGIELFAICDVVINEGKGDLGILTSARLVQFYRHIMEDYDTMQFAYEVIKLTSSASEMVDEPEWYDVLSETLMALDVLTIPRQLVQTWFYLRYAALLGYELSLFNDVDGQPLSPEKTYMYDVGEKGLRVSSRGELTADHIKFLRLINAKPLRALAQVGGVDEILPDCWQVARQHAAI